MKNIEVKIDEQDDITITTPHWYQTITIDIGGGHSISLGIDGAMGGKNFSIRADLKPGQGVVFSAIEKGFITLPVKSEERLASASFKAPEE